MDMIPHVCYPIRRPQSRLMLCGADELMQVGHVLRID